jgi:hypothetical protein
MATLKRSSRVLAVGGLALAVLGPTGGPLAQAAPAPAPTYHWCPGDQWDPSWGKAYDWTGITATTGKARQAKPVRPALGPGESRRHGRRRSHPHRRGRQGHW